MTYEDEQIKYAEELKEITFAISRLDEIFEDSSKTDVKILEYYKQLNPSRFQFSSSFEIQQQISLFRNLLEEDYRRKTARKKAHHNTPVFYFQRPYPQATERI